MLPAMLCGVLAAQLVALALPRPSLSTSTARGVTCWSSTVRVREATAGMARALSGIGLPCARRSRMDAVEMTRRQMIHQMLRDSHVSLHH